MAKGKSGRKTAAKSGSTAGAITDTTLVILGAAFIADDVADAAVNLSKLGLPIPAPGTSAPARIVYALLGLLFLGIGLRSHLASPLLELYRRRTAPRPPPPSATLPPDPIRHFVGRETELERLRQRLVADSRAAVSGLGGIGKTALAAEYAHRHRDAYPAGVFWLRAEEPAVLIGDLASLAWPLQLREREERDREQVIRAVIRWLQEHEGWLLVIDNLDERTLPVLERRLPPGLRGHVLATSRHPSWDATFPDLEPLPLDLATRFLLDRSGQVDQETAELIAGRLGGLPLALEQAGAYLQETRESLTGYLHLLRVDLAGTLDQGRLDRDLEPVARTWKVSFQRVQTASPAAAELLRLCSFYAPDDIPLSLLEGTRPHLHRRSRLRASLSRRFEFNRAIGVLLRYSLARRQGELLSVHRLVQDVVRLSLSPNQLRSWVAAASLAMDAEFPHGWEFANWPRCRPLLTHVLAVTQMAVSLEAEPQTTARLLNAAASYLHASGQLAAARPLLESALAIRERVLGPDHPSTATSLNNLAGLLQAQGELAAARPLYERALAIRERVLGPDHPDTATVRTFLGQLRA